MSGSSKPEAEGKYCHFPSPKEAGPPGTLSAPLLLGYPLLCAWPGRGPDQPLPQTFSLLRPVSQPVAPLERSQEPLEDSSVFWPFHWSLIPFIHSLTEKRKRYACPESIDDRIGSFPFLLGKEVQAGSNCLFCHLSLLRKWKTKQNKTHHPTGFSKVTRDLFARE